MSADVTVYERDVWIVRYLRQARDNRRTIRDIWNAARKPRVLDDPRTEVRPLGGLDEQASLPTYHRTVNKLVGRGQLEMDSGEDGEAARFRVAPGVSSVTPLTQVDLNEALWELGAAPALAMYADSVEQFERDGARILEAAAEALLREDPRALVLRMLQETARDLDADLADLRDPDTAEDQHRQRLERRLAEFGRFVHGELGLNPAVWHVPTLDELDQAGATRLTPRDLTRVEPVIQPDDWDEVAGELALHVFGATFIAYAEVREGDEEARPLVVAGSDGSSHVGLVRGMPAAAYSDHERLTMTFNNGAGYVEIPETHPARARVPSPFHGVPATRAALEDPGLKGMIVSRPYFPNLDDGEFEHLKKAALDVVQFRIDHALLAGSALPYGAHPVRGGEPLPRPHVLLRDGAVSPQARELQNYTNRNEYGDMVREGIQLSHRILRLVLESDRRVFAGAVKSTQLRTFSRIVDWYIQRGSAATHGRALDPNWDARRMSVISDSVAMSRLLASLPELPRRSQYYRTCVIVRPFPAMVTSLFRVRVCRDPRDWIAYFERETADAVQRYRSRGGNRPFFDGREVEDDDYVQLCARADYGMFYFGRPGGSPQLNFPRFEFLDSIRTLGDAAGREGRVGNTVDLILRAVHRTKWSLDYEHNMMTDRRLPKLVPYVVSRSHEMGKVLGHKLVNELQQAIAASLSGLKALRGLSVPKIEIEPVSQERFRRYLARLRRGAERQGEALGDEAPNAQQELPAGTPGARGRSGGDGGNDGWDLDPERRPE